MLGAMADLVESECPMSDWKVIERPFRSQNETERGKQKTDES
jgi:hypothetical protein